MLTQVVKNIKNHIKAMSKAENFVELFDVNNDSVVFYVNDPGEIAVGVEATPDGEFMFSDGMKVIISEGLVQSIEKEEEVVEEPVAEETPTEEIKEDEKDLKIAELEAKIKELEEILKSKEDEIKTTEEDLKEIQNFYTNINKSNSRTEMKSTKKSFSFKGTK